MPAGWVAGATALAGAAGAAASSSAANSASSAANNATNQQSALTQEGINITQGNTKAYRVQGQSALGGVLQLLGLGANGQLGGGNNQAINNLVSNLPGYQFQLGQGEKAITNAAQGTSGLSSAALTGLDQYASGVAQNAYGQELTGLGGLTSLGENAAVGSGNTAGSLIGATSPGIASSIQNAGNAQAAGTIGSTNAITGGLVNGLGYANSQGTGLGNLTGNINNLTGGALNNNNAAGGNNTSFDNFGGQIVSLPNQ